MGPYDPTCRVSRLALALRGRHPPVPGVGLPQPVGTAMQNPVSTEKLTELEQRMQALGITAENLLEKFVRGSGAGGQKINKTSSCVFLKHLPSGLTIKCQADRSREMNRFLARRELCEEMEAIRDGKESERVQEMEKIRRQKRRRSRRSKQRSVADKRILSIKKNLRRPPSGE